MEMGWVLVDFTRRYKGAVDTALAQYRMNKLISKITETIRFLELVIELYLVYNVESSYIAKEDKTLLQRLE